MFSKLQIYILTLLSCCCLASVIASDIPVDMNSIPSDFTRFKLGDHSEQTDLLNHYMWYHYKTRISLTQAVFPLEYLTTADLWLRMVIRPG